jgi:NAD+ diphosphatase
MALPQYCSTCGSKLELQKRDELERLVCSDESCDYVFWNNPTPVVGAIVQQGDNIILVQNIGWPKHWYALVTGFLEANESAEDGIKREVEEEIGIVPKTVNFVGLYPFFRMNQLLIIYHVEVDENAEVVLQANELVDYRKVPIAEVQPWDAGTGHGLRDWLRTKGYERELISLNDIKN